MTVVAEMVTVLPAVTVAAGKVVLAWITLGVIVSGAPPVLTVAPPTMLVLWTTGGVTVGATAVSIVVNELVAATVLGAMVTGDCAVTVGAGKVVLA